MRTNVPVRVGATAPTPRTFSPFLSLRREIDRMFDDFRWGSGRFWPELPSMDLTPTMGVTETEKEYEVKAELPGMEEKDVEVTLSEGMLTVSTPFSRVALIVSGSTPAGSSSERLNLP